MPIVAVMTLALASAGAEPVRAGLVFGAPGNLGPEVNSSDSELDPSISANGPELYFQSGRPEGCGDSDLHVATRATTKEEWGKTVNPGPVVKSANAESQWLVANRRIDADGRIHSFRYRRGTWHRGIPRWSDTSAAA